MKFFKRKKEEPITYKIVTDGESFAIKSSDGQLLYKTDNSSAFTSYFNIDDACWRTEDECKLLLRRLLA